MASEISPKAEVSPKAKIGDNVKIFPFAYIEDDVEIGDGCIIFPFVSICAGRSASLATAIFSVRMWSLTVLPILVDRRLSVMRTC